MTTPSKLNTGKGKIKGLIARGHGYFVMFPF